MIKGDLDGETANWERTEPDAGGDDGTISVLRLIRTLWGYRRAIAAAVSGVMIGFTLWGLRTYVRQSTERHATLEFRLIFEGADRNEYPNGLPFGRGEIIASPVLTAVYEANKLERYCTYEEFRSALFVLESNPELELMALEYQSKLGDNRISPVDRAGLEEEFLQKREALRVPQYTLNFLSPGGYVSVPEQLMTKVLNDVLAEWAEQVATRKGVLRYQVNMYSENLLVTEFLDVDDYIVRVDILRGKVNRFISNLEDLEVLPGATVVRVGENRISVPEILANLEDLMRYRLEPLTGYIWANSLSRDVDLLRPYLETRQFQIMLDFQEAQGRGTILEESLRGYIAAIGPSFGSQVEDGGGLATGGSLAGVTALIPQIGDSFLDRIIDMAGGTADREYRQELTDRIIDERQQTVMLEREAAYYERMTELMLRALSFSGDAPDFEAVRDVENRFAEIYDAVVQAVEQSNAIYLELSAQNLNPRTNLFTITSPFAVTTQRAVTLRTLTPYGLIVLMLGLILVSLACLIHHYFQFQILSARPARQPDVPQQEAPKARVEPTLGS